MKFYYFYQFELKIKLINLSVGLKYQLHDINNLNILLQEEMNSKNKEVENIDLIKALYNYLTTDFFNCQVSKVAGHANICGNELADALATNDMVKFDKLLKKYEIIDK